LSIHSREEYNEFLRLTKENKQVGEISKILEIPYATICNWKYSGRLPWRYPGLSVEDKKKCSHCGIKLTKKNKLKYERLCKTCSRKRRDENYVEKERILQKKLHLKDKIEAFQHYCNGEIKCMNPNCLVPNGARDIRVLSIDHISGGGNKHRKLNSIYHIYHWLIKNNYPEGFQVLCMNCQFIKRHENKELSKIK
jgi:hypothetical protein